MPAIIEATGMPRRTAQDTIIALAELGIEVEFTGGTKNGHYQVNDWGAVYKGWIEKNIEHIKGTLEYL